MGSTFKFSLRRFDREVDIPEELEGIDPELAMELMREHGLIEEEGQAGGQQGDKGDSGTDDDNDNEPDGDDPNASAGSTAPDKEPNADDEDDDSDGEEDLEDNDNGDDKKVPLAALRDERGKRKKAQSEIEALRGEIAQLRNQSQGSTQQQAGQQQQQQPDQQKQDDARTIRRKLIDSAKAIFAKENDNRQPDMLDEADLGEVMLIAGDLKRDYERQQVAIQQQYAERQKHSQSYLQFVHEQKASDDYDTIANAIVDEFEALPEDDQAVLGTAYNRCEAGVGTPQDFYLVKKFWNDTAAKQRATKRQKADTSEQAKKPAQAQPKKKTTEQKLEEIEKHPKTNLLNGGNTQAGPNFAELARKMQDGWDTLTEEEKTILLELE